MHTGSSRQVAVGLVDGRGPDDAAARREKFGLEVGSMWLKGVESIVANPVMVQLSRC